MTNRLSNVQARIESVYQLSAVVTAMRGIAAARSREAKSHLEGIRTYSEMIGKAIGTALAFLPPQPARSPSDARTSGMLVALCAGQGFACTFSEHILDAATDMLAATQDRLLLIGDRGLMLAAERSLEVEWAAPMIAHLDQMTDLADRIVEALYERIGSGALSRVTLIYTSVATSGQMEIHRRKVIPFDFGHFVPASSQQPLITIQPPRLLEQLAEEFVFTEICEALTISFAAENEARTRSMVAAKTNVDKTLETLVPLSRRLRQEEITNEIIELSASFLSPRF